MEGLNISALLDGASSDLYQSANCLQGAGGYVISPLSILYAGALLYFGSNGPTKSNLNTSLHFRNAFGPKSDITKVKGLFDNTAKLLSVEQLSGTGKPTKIPIKQKTQVALINGIFLDKSLAVKSSYQDDVTKLLHGFIGTENFKNQAGAVSDINDWVKINTFGAISDSIGTEVVGPTTNLVLANTLYFRAAWNQHFPEVQSSDPQQPFFSLDGKSKQTTMMYARRAIPYAEDDTLDVQYIELPYVDDFLLLIILPRQLDGIRSLERAFTKDTLRYLRGKVPALKAGDQRLVNIRIPRFKLQGTIDLAKLLAKAGVTYAVGPNADFSNMVSNGKPILSTSTHKVVFSLDEWGTEASAASTMNAPLGMMGPSKPWEPDYAPANFTADHPFMFAVKHRPSEAVLFIGRVESV